MIQAQGLATEEYVRRSRHRRWKTGHHINEETRGTPAGGSIPAGGTWKDGR